MLKVLIERYWQLTLFRDTPDNMPYSRALMYLTGLLFFLLMLLQWRLTESSLVLPFTRIFFADLSLFFSYVLYSLTLLLLFKLTSRLVQTLTALWASHFIIHLIALPFLMLSPYLEKADTKEPLVFLLAVIYLFLTLILSIWQFLITAHIYRYALNISPMQSMLSSIGLLALNILTVSLWR